jgi:hypothetical protein
VDHQVLGGNGTAGSSVISGNGTAGSSGISGYTFTNTTNLTTTEQLRGQLY